MAVVDVEGGAATLYVTPSGHSLLVDTGFPAGLGPRGEPTPVGPSSAERIVDAAHRLGVRRIDLLVVSHYHLDHVGGVAELVSRIPVGEIIDHGPNREDAPGPPDRPQAAPSRLYADYLRAIEGHPHRVVRPGDTLWLDRLNIRVVAADGETLQAVRLPPPGPRSCANSINSSETGGEENRRSVGLVLLWGRARILDLGDAVGSVEFRLVCPFDEIGPVDVMLADNHGSNIANAQQLIDAARPKVVVVQNSAKKGADAEVLRRFSSASLWQMHTAERSGEANTAEARIANLGAETHASLFLSIPRSGEVFVTNGRTGRVFAAVRRDRSGRKVRKS